MTTIGFIQAGLDITDKEARMRVGIFYFSLKPGKDRQRIVIPGGQRGPLRDGYIRVEVFEALDLAAGLDLAMPLPGETVMNTHEVAP